MGRSGESEDHSAHICRLNETASIIRRTYFALVSVCIFGIITIIGTPDVELIRLTSKVQLPIINHTVDFILFVFLYPLLLLAMTVYLQVFIASYEDALSRHSINAEMLIPTIFTLKLKSADLIAKLLFYYIAPFTLAIFAWKMWPVKSFGITVLLYFLVLAAGMVVVQICRLRKRGNAITTVTTLLAIALLAIFVLIGVFDLRVFNLSNSDMKNRTLENYSFDSVIFDNAVFTGARFYNVEIESGIFNNALFDGAIFDGRGSNSAKLKDSIIQDADFSHATFSSFPISNSIITHSHFEMSSFDAALFDNVTISDNTSFNGASLSGGCQIGDSHIYASIFNDSVLLEPIVTDSNFARTDLQRVIINGGEFRGTRFEKSDLNGSEIRDTVFVDCRFEETDLTNVRLIDVTFKRTTFENMDLGGVDLSRVKEITQNDFIHSCGNHNTKMPPGLSPLEECMVKDEYR